MVLGKVKISRKGQIVIPSKIRNSLNTDLLEIVLEENKIILQPVKSVLNIAGSLKKYSQNVVVDDNENKVKETAWEEHVKEKFSRS